MYFSSRSLSRVSRQTCRGQKLALYPACPDKHVGNKRVGAGDNHRLKFTNCPIWVPFILFFLLFTGTWKHVSAQTIPVGDLREEQLRLQQLLNDTLSASSFTNRPLWNNIYESYMDAADGRSGWWNRKMTTLEYNLDFGFRVGIYEPVVQSTTNSKIPFSQNNGAAWYSKGINSELQGGFYVTSDYLTITFRPQLVWQQNNEFIVPRFIPEDETGQIRYVAEGISNRIDRPFRFGADPFWTADPGNSSIRIHYNVLEAGFSTEPLWWGGSILYPLMMSNNAPGMKHLFIGTRGPLELPLLGSIEFRWMGGWPEDSDYFDLDEKYQRDRFMNAINITYSPSFIPNFHLGLTRAYHFYIEDEGLRWNDLFVIADPFQKKKLIEKRGPDNERKPRNQLASIYMRWLWPEQNLEIFAEYFRDDHSWDMRDLLLEPYHNSGYSIGFQNLIEVPYLDFMKFHLEYTRLTPSRLDEIRNQTYYYSHSLIPQGHTNRGQVLGAAIGPGSNSLFLGVDGYKDNLTVGIFVQRWADNDHFHYEYNQPRGTRFYGDKWRHRINLDIGSRFVYGPGPWYLTGHVTWTKAYNYGRNDYGIYNDIDWDTRELDDLYNIQMQLSLRYIF